MMTIMMIVIIIIDDDNDNDADDDDDDHRSTLEDLSRAPQNDLHIRGFMAANKL